jgi:hypothetical protein
MTQTDWSTHLEHGGFPIEKATLGSCDLPALHVGGEWQWLVRQAGRDVAEGAALRLADAPSEAERVALNCRL